VNLIEVNGFVADDVEPRLRGKTGVSGRLGGFPCRILRLGCNLLVSRGFPGGWGR
jgi:hypothetical protein